MRNLLKKSSTGLLCAILTASVFAAKQSKELLTPENMKKWESGIESRYRGAIKFDSNKRQVSISTYESNGQAEFYDLKNQYDDFRIDCVVSFSKLRNKWSGFNIYLRAGDGKHYWVFWRPKNRNLDVVKIHSKHKVIGEYNKGSKMFRLPPKIKMNKDYTFSVEMRGRLLRVFLDGKKILECIDPLPELYTSGKIAFTGGSSDLIIKSIKITDLRESEKLAIKNYKYINPPEKGDRSGNILADGKINGKDKQALWWLATKGDPVIVFDLGKQYFINGIELKALAVPSSNISAYRVFGSDDGKKWKLMAGEVNNSTDSREQEQTLHSKFSALARYLKVMLFRQAGDATIKLDEVEIMGREVRPEDKAATQVSKEYYKGPKIPAVTINGKKDKNWHYLEGGGLRVAINQRTGNIGPIYNISKRKRCTMFTYDKYYVETKKSAQEFSEKNNTVIKSSNKNGVLIFTCRNKNIKDIDIVQTYKSTADGFSKTTELINRGGREDLFVTLKTGTVLDQKFRKNGWYLGADRGLGSRLKASQVTMPMTATCQSPQNTKVVLFMNYDKNFGIGQYRYAINGKYCSPVAGSFTEKSNHASLYTANGWKVGLTTLHLKPGRQQSIETRWNLFPDDEFFFLKQYTADTEVNKLFNIKRADWLYRIKTCNAAMSTPVCRSNKEFTMRWIKRSADLYDDGFIYSFFCADDVWGDWYDGKRYGLGWRGEKVDNNFYRELLDDLRKQSANIKVGVYTWAWTGWPYSKSYLKHPDWFIAKNKNGYLSKAYQNGPMNFLRRISASGCMENLLTCARKIIKQYDSDAFYIDGGGGGINRIDWQRLKLDLDSDWYKFHWELNKLCRKIGGRERVFFTNSRSEAYVDIGYYEGANNVLGATSWRSSGDALLALKMRNSLFPKMTFPLLYWRSNTLPFYSNYCVGLGLVPYNIYSSHELRNVAYVTAAYESRMFKFTPSGLIPDWRKNLESQLEAYTMTHAPAGFISIINHSKLPIPETISADAKKLGLDTRKPIFCWLTRMHDIRNRKRTTGMSERTAKKVYSNSNWGVDLVAAPTFKGIVKTSNGRVSLTEKFDHNILNMAMFSNCPAVVFAVNGRRKQIWQPNTRGITLMVTLT